MDEFELIATFDTEETAGIIAGLINKWLTHLDDEDGEEDMPDFFEDYGVSVEDYAIEKDEFEWEEIPNASALSNKVTVSMDGPEAMDVFQELLEALGAYDVLSSKDEEG